MSRNMQMIAHIAIFMDLTALNGRFEVGNFLPKLRQQGRLLIQKAYADSNRYISIKQEMIENAIELTEIPTDIAENQCHSAIHLTVDVLETLFAKSHIDTFVLCIGESDYTALFSKLRAFNKRVIIICNATHIHSKWKAYCDEVYDYESFIEKSETTDYANVNFTNPNLSRLTGRSVYGTLKKAIAILSASRETVYDWQIKDYLENDEVPFKVEEYNFKTWEGLWQKAKADNVITCQETDNGLAIALFTYPKLQEDKSFISDESLALFYQATLISPTFDGDRITLSDIALSMRRLSPNFKPTSRGSSGGFKSIMLEAEAKGYVQVFSEVLQGSIQYSVRVLPQFHTVFASSEKNNVPEKTSNIVPKTLERSIYKTENSSYSSYLWEQNLYADMASLKSLCDTIDEYIFSTHQNEDVNIKSVFSHCIAMQTSSYNEQICRRAFNTILASNILFSANNTPITKVYVPVIVEEMELWEDAEQLIQKYIKAQLTQHFGENLDESKLQLLFYGKSSAIPERM